MTTINKQEIKNFLITKPGYLREGGKRLKKVFLNKGFITTIVECKDAIREVNQELRGNMAITDTEAKILFYDIEVSYGLARLWKPGYNLTVQYDDFVQHPKIICISYKWNNSEEVSTVRWDKNKDDKTLLELFIEELNSADFIVGHNANNFDLPWIRTRALFHDLEMLPTYKAVDTLKIARSKHRFPSNRLDAIGDYLGVGRKIKTERNLWVDTIEGTDGKDTKALDKMVEYCEQDVLLLEAVYNKLASQELPVIHAGTLHGESKQTSPYTGKTEMIVVKTTTSKAGTKKYLMKDTLNNKYFEFSDTDYKKFILAQ